MNIVKELRSERQPTVKNCQNDNGKCRKMKYFDDGESVCVAYFNPTTKWRNGDCPLADEFLKKSFVDSKKKEKVRVGQQKQKKKR